jgi:hypothetical protein
LIEIDDSYQYVWLLLFRILSKSAHLVSPSLHHDELAEQGYAALKNSDPLLCALMRAYPNAPTLIEREVRATR